MLSLVASEIKHHMFMCGEVLSGGMSLTVCQSAPIRNSDQTCKADYQVTRRVGDKQPETAVSVSCQLPNGAYGGTHVSFPGSHTNIGLSWRDARTIDVSLPSGIKPRTTPYGTEKVTMNVRTRAASDTSASTQCVPPGKDHSQNEGIEWSRLGLGA